MQKSALLDHRLKGDVGVPRSLLVRTWPGLRGYLLSGVVSVSPSTTALVTGDNP